jgi:hypothetical protein
MTNGSSCFAENIQARERFNAFVYILILSFLFGLGFHDEIIIAIKHLKLSYFNTDESIFFCPSKGKHLFLFKLSNAIALRKGGL